MEWLQAKSVEELKKYKTLKNLRSEIKNDIALLFKDKESKDKNIINMITINSGSWQGMLDKIKALREVVKDLAIKDINIITFNIDKEDTKEINHEGYFKSLEDEYIFYILELDGLKRADKLNITEKCYSNKKIAKSWRDNILKIIHPDKCNKAGADKAVIKINEIYREMIGYE